MIPMIVEFLKIFHEEDSFIGTTGLSTQFKHHPVTNGPNPPMYRKGDLAEAKVVGTTFCCADMAHQFRLGAVGFGTRPDETYRNKVAEVFVRVEGGSQNDIAIPYCPWCREPILTFEIQPETEEVETGGEG